MTLTWGQLVVVALGAVAVCLLVFGFAVIAYDDICDPTAGRQFDDDWDVDPDVACTADLDDWADVIQIRHHITTQNGPDRAA